MEKESSMILFDFDSTLSSVEMFDIIGMVVDICENRYQGNSLAFDCDIFFNEYLQGNYQHQLKYHKNQSYDTLLTFKLKDKLDNEKIANQIFSQRTIDDYRDKDEGYKWFYSAVIELLKHLKFKVDLLEKIGIFIWLNYIAKDKIKLINKLKNNGHYVAIASGGFYDIIKMSAQNLDVDLFAVSINKDKDSLISLKYDGFDVGKSAGLKSSLNYSSYRNRIIVGDGSNDREVFDDGVCNKWIAYSEIHQHNFHNQATSIAKDFNEVDEYLSELI